MSKIRHLNQRKIQNVLYLYKPILIGTFKFKHFHDRSEFIKFFLSNSSSKQKRKKSTSGIPQIDLMSTSETEENTVTTSAQKSENLMSRSQPASKHNPQQQSHESVTSQHIILANQG